MRKMRAAAQTTATAQRITPTKPTHGCHHGTPAGRACRISMMTGVKGGMNDIAVAKTPFGCCMIGVIINIGIKVGINKTNARCCASCGVPQADPSATPTAESIATSAIKYTKNHGSTCSGASPNIAIPGQHQQSADDVKRRTGQGCSQRGQHLAHHELEGRCGAQQHFKHALHLVFGNRAQLRRRPEENHHDQQIDQEERYRPRLDRISLFAFRDLPRRWISSPAVSWTLPGHLAELLELGADRRPVAPDARAAGHR